MESNLLSSKNETLVAFRIAAKDVEFFKQMADDHYKRGDIKTPTVAALGKWNLYWTCNMLKDLEKARILTDQQQFQNSYGEPEVEEPKISCSMNHGDSFPTSFLPSTDHPKVSYPNDTILQNEMIDGKGDSDGLSIRRPFFYEIFPDWQKQKKLQGQNNKATR